MSKNNLIYIAGSLWGIIGIFLIFRGAGLYQLAVEEQNSTQMAVMISLILGVLIGSAKGLFVLSKTAKRNKSRIQSLQSPAKIHQIFSKPFYFLIAGMMGLGFLLRSLNGYLGGYIVVAAIYCGVGMALIVGSRTYWKTEAEPPVEDTQ